MKWFERRGDDAAGRAGSDGAHHYPVGSPPAAE
jgi:hypothetical protein